MTTPQVQVATTSDELQTIDVIVLTFSSDPVVHRLYPDAHQYLTNVPAFVRGFGGRAFDNGNAYYIDGFLGAALLLPPDVHPDEDALMELIQRTVPEKACFPYSIN